MAEAKHGKLLRYRFGGAAQLQNHLHVLEGRTLLFWRDSVAPLLAVGDRAVLELCFDDSEQRMLLRGAVLARVEGTLPGSWLEFPDARLSRKLEGGKGGVADRKQRRLGCDLLAEVRQNEHVQMGRITDLSMGGARVSGLNAMPNKEDVSVRLVMPPRDYPSELGRAQLVRAERNEAGVRFHRADANARLSLTRLFAAVQQQWAQTPELTHPLQCCRGAVMLDPPPPRIKSGRIVPP